VSADVVTLPGSGDLPECPVQIERAKFSMCQHDRIVLDEERRVVRCAACSKVFDPFTYLLGNAQTITRAWADYRFVQQRLQEKQASVEALSAEEKRLKARVKTAKEKVEPGIDIKGKWL